jgi:Fe-S-cluster containining protein
VSQSEQPCRVLAPLRHRCGGCGASCESVQVSLPRPEARAQVLRQARELGIPDPIIDGHLRRVGARCAFLDERDECRIHARFGGAAKPVACQQFPLVRVETESGPRAGIDPECFHAHGPVAALPLLDSTGLLARSVHFDPEQAHSEGVLLGALGAEDASVAQVLSLLAGRPPGPAGALPPGLAGRWIQRLQGAGLERFLDPEIAGAGLRGSLWPAFARVPALDPGSPPAWPVLDDQGEAVVLQAVRALVFLRLCASQLELVQGVTLLGLLGGVLLAWNDPGHEPLARGMAGWCRLMRGPHFWRALTPDLDHMLWLAQGR